MNDRDPVLRDPAEQKRRRRERITAVVLFVVLIAFTAVEVYLLRLASRLPFVNSIFFFGLMNLNIVLIMLLLFLVFRNAVKLLLDEKPGPAGGGQRLKTRLVFSFILFAIIPTVLLFSISAFYIKSSFDKWFSIKVGGTLSRSIEVVRNYYQNTERNAAHFARKIAFSLEGVRGDPATLARRLSEARMEYGLDAVEYYADPFSARVVSAHPERNDVIPPASLETLQRSFAGNNECRIQHVGAGELVRCGAFLGPNRGVVYADAFIPIGLASSLSEISLTYKDYNRDNPLNYPIKSTYFAILTMVTLLILFSAIWTGFHVAKRLTGPLDELLKATEEVGHGNLDLQIPVFGSYEMSRLMDSFNAMTRELKGNRHELVHRRRYIEVLLESVQSGVVSLDENGRISMVNPAAAELLRLPGAELLGKPYWAIVPDQHRAEFRELLLQVTGTAKPVRRELRIRTDEGWIALLFTLSVLRDENRRHLGIVAVFDDVTDIQKMERMLAWREVAKRIAHEIKNPLTPIQLSVQRLRRRYLDKINDDGTFGEATNIILNEVDALKTLVNEFSSFARLPEVQLTPDDLNAVVMEAVNLFRAAHEGVLFDLRLSEALPLLDLDRANLKRAIVNLFDNAVSAMNRQGTVTVLTEYDKTQALVRLTVADDGCGIPEGALDQLFEPYFSMKAGGTGLGLAIVQRIVADHGGFVRVSRNEPRGSRFSIELPEGMKMSGRRPVARLGEAPNQQGMGPEGMV